MPAFSGAFDDDSSQPAINTNGQPVEQYIPPLYSQPAEPYAQPVYESQPYAPPVYSQPMQQYAPPMYGQPVQQYVPPMYGQPVQQYASPVYGQPVQQYVPPVYGQPVILPKKVTDRMTFRKHCSRVGLMLMADVGLMFGVQLVVIIVATIILAMMNPEFISATKDVDKILPYLLAPVMFAGGLSAIIGNMVPSALHLRKWRYTFTEPFKGEKLSPVFTLAALFTALGLNSAWCTAYYYLKAWFGEFMGYVPEESQTLYNPSSMPLIGMICYLVWVCIIAPVTEEYMFRGAMLRTLSTPMAFLIGLIMGYVAAKSGNIRQTIFIHMVNNIIASLPQILHYFLPGWYGSYEKYIGYFDYGTMIFAGLALLYFIFRRARGLSARKKRLASGSETKKRAELAWLRLEVPDERRLPQFDSVKHKFCHFVTSGGMIFFIIYCLLNILIISFLPYITKEPIPGMGF